MDRDSTFIPSVAYHLGTPRRWVSPVAGDSSLEPNLPSYRSIPGLRVTPRPTRERPIQWASDDSIPVADTTVRLRGGGKSWFLISCVTYYTNH